MSKESKIEDAVFEYMKAQNRPYSAMDVFSNLHKAHGKTAVVKAMENLAVAGKLLEKIYGKSKIYVVSQSVFVEVDEVEIEKMDKEIKDLSEKYEHSLNNLKKVKSELKTLTSSLTTSDAKTQVAATRSEAEDLKKRVQLAKSAMNDMPVEDMKKISDNHKVFIGHWKKRKRMTSDLINAVLEGYPKSKKVFLDEVGIETDEDCDVRVPLT